MATTLPVAPAPRPIWGRVLIGCALVGGLVILAGAATCVFGMYWLTSAGKHYATAAVASPQSQGVVRVSDLAADPGARALLAAFFKRVQEAGQAEGQPQLPAWVRNLQAYQARQGISQWLPREASVSFEPDGEGVPRFVLAANMRGFVQPIRLALTQSMKGDPKSRITRHGEHQILNFGQQAAVCFMDGTLVVTGDGMTMASALDRLAAAGSSPRPAEERGLPGNWDVTGWLDEHTGAGALIALLSPTEEPLLVDGAPLGALRNVRFGIDVESAERARLVAEIAFADADGAARGQAWLADGVARLRGRWEASGLQSASSDSVDADRVRYELTLTGIEEAFARKLREQERSSRER